MNFRVLLKALIPSKNFLVLVAYILAFMLIGTSVVALLAWGILCTLRWAFGETTTMYIILATWLGPMAYVLIIHPIYNRYQRILREDQRSK